MQHFTDPHGRIERKIMPNMVPNKKMFGQYAHPSTQQAMRRADSLPHGIDIQVVPWPSSTGMPSQSGQSHSRQSSRERHHHHSSEAEDVLTYQLVQPPKRASTYTIARPMGLNRAAEYSTGSFASQMRTSGPPRNTTLPSSLPLPRNYDTDR